VAIWEESRLILKKKKKKKSKKKKQKRNNSTKNKDSRKMQKNPTNLHIKIKKFQKSIKKQQDSTHKRTLLSYFII